MEAILKNIWRPVLQGNPSQSDVINLNAVVEEFKAENFEKAELITNTYFKL